MKIAIIEFPGSNCERETILAVRRAGMEPVPFLWNEAADMLDSMSGFILVGGFSYEDRSRAGIIAALDPLMDKIAEQAEKGKPVLGICNGAQILLESGLVPGLKDYRLAAALAENRRVTEGKLQGTGFYNAWVYLCSNGKTSNAFTRFLDKGQVISVPSAHAEGRFLMSEDLLAEVQKKGLDALLYCDRDAEITPEFPHNPNGSMGNIAALTNAAGNVMAMMPHPERTEAGDLLFQSMHDYIASGAFKKTPPLDYEPISLQAKSYSNAEKAEEYIIRLMITDNQALSVENRLKQMGMAVSVKRFSYWAVQSSKETMPKLWDSGLLYNPRKACLLDKNELLVDKAGVMRFLVCSKDDIKARQTIQQLNDHFSIEDIGLQSGVIWEFRSDNGDMDALSQSILQTNIIANPYADDCYYYE